MLLPEYEFERAIFNNGFMYLWMSSIWVPSSFNFFFFHIFYLDLWLKPSSFNFILFYFYLFIYFALGLLSLQSYKYLKIDCLRIWFVHQKFYCFYLCQISTIHKILLHAIPWCFKVWCFCNLLMKLFCGLQMWFAWICLFFFFLGFFSFSVVQNGYELDAFWKLFVLYRVIMCICWLWL